MTTLSNWLLVSGSGRNTGKTSLICGILKQMSQLNPVAVKISSHLHDLPEESDFLIKENDFALIRETFQNTKDSSRMLQSGAESAFYAQGSDEHLPQILSALQPFTQSRPVICESGGLRKYIVPGFYIMLRGNEIKPEFLILEKNADLMLDSADFLKNGFKHKLEFKNNNWILIS